MTCLLLTVFVSFSPFWITLSCFNKTARKYLPCQLFTSCLKIGSKLTPVLQLQYEHKALWARSSRNVKEDLVKLALSCQNSSQTAWSILYINACSCIGSRNQRKVKTSSRRQSNPGQPVLTCQCSDHHAMTTGLINVTVVSHLYNDWSTLAILYVLFYEPTVLQC